MGLRARALPLVAGAVALIAACGGNGATSGATTEFAPTSPAPATTVSVAAPTSTTALPSTTDTTTTAAPTTTTTYAPASLRSVREGEGEWKVAASLGGVPVVWTTRVHPLERKPGVVATAAVLDQSRLRAVLYNGTVLPGGRGWKHSARVPASMVPALVATLNGGFELKHMKGGYFTEGRTVKRLRDGDATLAIDEAGRVLLGVYGKDFTNDGTWVTLRQNLPPVVLDGEVAIDAAPGTYWGDDYGDVSDNFRSGICTLADGRLMYVAMGLVDIRPFAQGLVAMGCQMAMALDQNGTWPHFATYSDPGAEKRKGVLLDRRMAQPNRALSRSKKDFVAFFSELPSG